MIACAPRPGSSEIHAQNLDGDKYTPQSFTASRIGEKAGVVDGDSWSLDIDKTKLRWESYVKAGYFVSPPILLELLSTVLYPSSRDAECKIRQLGSVE